MQSIHLHPGVQINRRQPLVSIHWDYQNISNAKIAKDVLIFASSLGYVVTRKVYNNWESSSKAKQVLEGLDFECIHVSRRVKNAVDFKLVIDCTCECSSYLSPDIVILMCGDCYGEILLDELQPKSKKVIIIAQKQSEDKNLRELANKFYYVDELSNLVADNPPSQTDSVQFEITYQDAIECLTEAIQAAFKKGKPAIISRVCNLMRDNPRFPNYQKVSSIRKKDGTKFPDFSKFVDAAVADGKVRMQNQELFLN